MIVRKMRKHGRQAIGFRVPPIALVRLSVSARRTFGSAAAARRWLHRPHPMLGGEAPLAFARTGTEALSQVHSLLVAIQYGGSA